MLNLLFIYFFILKSLFLKQKECSIKKYMARAMAGTVVYAGEGKIRPSEIGEILDSGNRTAAGPTVPAGGLYMTHLWYDDGISKFECTP